jgi:hypothetical protein
LDGAKKRDFEFARMAIGPRSVACTAAGVIVVANGCYILFLNRHDNAGVVDEAPYVEEGFAVRAWRACGVTVYFDTIIGCNHAFFGTVPVAP